MIRTLIRSLAIFTLCLATPLAAKTYKVYFLGGQSNMVGFGYKHELPAPMQVPLERVPIFSGTPGMDEKPDIGEGKWTVLQPGFGLNAGFADGDYILSDRFGPEVTFAHTLSAQSPDENIAIIKYAWGGTALVDGVSGYGSWDPKVKKRNQYDYFLKVLNTAFSVRDIDRDGEDDILVPAGIVWMQGEADAFEDQSAAMHYQSNLTYLVGLFRAALRDNTLPVVIGRITDAREGQEKTVMKYSPQVRQAQQAFVRDDHCAALSTITDNLAYGEDDEWHYLSDGYIQMGQDFARLIRELEKQCD